MSDVTKPEPAFAELEALYAATPLAAIDRDRLRQWRPESSLWGRLKPLIARRAGARLCWTEVAGHRINYWDSGASDKPVLVLIHGFGSSKENWSFLSELMHREFRILAPDLPGFGNSTFRVDSDYRVETQAERMAEWLKQLGVASAFIAGSSMGGAIAASLAAHHPAMVNGLCLMNAAGVPGTRISMLEAGVLAGNNYLVANRPAEAQRVFQICFHSRKRLLGAVFGLLMGTEMAHRAPLNHAIFSDLVYSLSAVNASLPQVKSPTFVLWGDSDQVLDVSCVDAFLAAIPHAKAMVLPETGHLPMVEKPKDTATVLRAFFNAQHSIVHTENL
ncbi:pimeloyl-ACP methyl ester carboxylesterase [Litorivivens lipolytica]|uniref:Pimeloyl-ACP methyl ester carboxylesterase n=1 Tax=Litorivivens lipolytica TaxID=1524264 RepID=A0A7W4W1Z9_9GAMM|nr:pimeloyl-ACP methyl ester carboxylesterase [Litorivivens lipolytica]